MDGRRCGYAAPVSALSDRIAAADRWQQRHRFAGFPYAVLQKYGEDQGSYLAATITYYAFFSLFPLLLVLTTVLGYVLSGHPHLYTSIVDQALGQFPLIGHDLRQHRLGGSALALGLGIAGALWAGMGVFLAAQNAMNQVWGVPFVRRPDFLRTRLRALVLLAVLGGGMLVAAGLAGLASVGAGYGPLWKAGSVVLGLALDIGLVWVGMRVLTSRDVTWRQLRGGAVVGGLGYAGLQALGGWYVGHELRNASNTYGTFALVIGLLSWIYLAAHVLLLCAEGNVVATERLWPRSLTLMGPHPPTDADRRALALRAEVEERRPDEDVDVEIGGPYGQGGPDGQGGADGQNRAPGQGAAPGEARARRRPGAQERPGGAG